MKQALISEIDKVPFSKSFSGHETFAFLYSSLKKGVDFVRNDTAVFQSDEAGIRFGVGKNMVRSIRHWCLLSAVYDYALIQFWTLTNSNKRTLELRDTLRSQGSPGLVFRYEQETTLGYLDKLKEV